MLDKFWVGICVQLGQKPGPHHHPHIPPQPRRTRDGPSRQRRRARRAAARQEHAEEAIEENEETNENEAEEAVYVEENEAAEVEINTEVTDEFCPDTDYSVDDLNEENSVTFRFVINDTAENESLVAFESLVKQNFFNTKVEAKDQLYVISGHEHHKNQTKLYIKVKNNPEVLTAVWKMKSETIF